MSRFISDANGSLSEPFICHGYFSGRNRQATSAASHLFISPAKIQMSVAADLISCRRFILITVKLQSAGERLSPGAADQTG